MRVVLVFEGPNLGKGIEETAGFPMSKPGVDVAVQLHGDTAPPVPPPRRRSWRFGALVGGRRRRDEELVHGAAWLGFEFDR